MPAMPKRTDEKKCVACGGTGKASKGGGKCVPCNGTGVKQSCQKINPLGLRR